jgi:hypothetical protein
MDMKKILFICFSILLIGCKDKNELPEGIMTRQEMFPLMLDIYVAEEKLTDLGIPRDTLINIYETYEGMLFEKHNTDHEVYKRSLAYYYENPKGLEMIYEKILDSLTISESLILSKIESEKAIVDSTKNKDILK